MCLNAEKTGCSQILSMPYLPMCDPHWCKANWLTKKRSLERLTSPQRHSFKIVYNVAISHDMSSLPVNLVPSTKANRKIHRRAGCVAGRPTGATEGGLPWLPAGCLQEPNQTATICHFFAVKVKRLAQQQTLTNNFCKATSNQAVSMRETWTTPRQMQPILINSHI